MNLNRSSYSKLSNRSFRSLFYYFLFTFPPDLHFKYFKLTLSITSNYTSHVTDFFLSRPKILVCIVQMVEPSETFGSFNILSRKTNFRCRSPTKRIDDIILNKRASLWYYCLYTDSYQSTYYICLRMRACSPSLQCESVRTIYLVSTFLFLSFTLLLIFFFGFLLRLFHNVRRLHISKRSVVNDFQAMNVWA